MAHIHLVSALFNKLDYVIAIFCLNNARHFLGSLRLNATFEKLRHKICFAVKSQAHRPA